MNVSRRVRAPAIALIDYGAGNLRSIGRALTDAGADVRILQDPEPHGSWDAVVLPGVGAFGAAMERLAARGFTSWMQTGVASGTPLVGVCLGMQLLYERSEEAGSVDGLGLLAGDVRRLPDGVKVPHMGWNQLTMIRPAEITAGLAEGVYAYFVHSYIVVPRDATGVLAVTTHGVPFPAIVFLEPGGGGPVVGLQFHPEKSGATGRALLRRVVTWAAGCRTLRRAAG